MQEIAEYFDAFYSGPVYRLTHGDVPYTDPPTSWSKTLEASEKYEALTGSGVGRGFRIKAIVNNAEEQALVNSNKIVNKAKLEADALIVRAEKDIEGKKVSMVRDVKQDIQGLVISLTEKVLRQSVDKDIDDKYITESLQDILSKNENKQ